MMSDDTKLSTKREVNWLCVVYNLQVFVSCLIGLHIAVYDASLRTTIFAFSLVLLAVLGQTAGSHRLWSHHSYKATTSLRIFLMLCQTLGGHGTIYNWVRLHRLHHKCFQTDLDPYNSKKGFLYSHIMSNVLELSPAQEKLLQEIDMSDLEADKVVMFQKRYYWFLFAILTLLLPINAPVEYWDEGIITTLFIVGWLRFGIFYHLSLLIHSAFTVFDLSHNDKNSLDSNMVFLINQSYWISYHYLSPWDYQPSEYGKYGTDCTSKFIRVCAALEYASDLKTVDSKLIRDALTMSVEENKPFSECVSNLEAAFNEKMSSQLYLMPSKFY